MHCRFVLCVCCMVCCNRYTTTSSPARVPSSSSPELKCTQIRNFQSTALSILSNQKPPPGLARLYVCKNECTKVYSGVPEVFCGSCSHFFFLFIHLS